MVVSEEENPEVIRQGLKGSGENAEGISERRRRARNGMPEAETKYFGRITYAEDSVIEFPAGLPGFEEERRFLAVEQAAARPLVFLQSLGCRDLCFLTVPVQAVDPRYELSITPEDLGILEWSGEGQPQIGADLLCLAMLSLSEGRSPTANLLAPVIVRMPSRRAVQAIRCDGAYSHQHALEDPAPCS